MGSGSPIVKKKRTHITKKEGGAILGIADIEIEPRGDPLPNPPSIKTGPKASKCKLQDDAIQRPTKTEPQVAKSERTEPQDDKRMS